MAQADRIVGKDLYVTFAGVVISGDFTSVSFSEEGDEADVTAGADTSHYYIPLGRKDGSCEVESFYGGSVSWQGLAVGSIGTLIVGPAGTASTKPKYTWTRATIRSRGQEIPFDDGVTFKAEIGFSSAGSEGVY